MDANDWIEIVSGDRILRGSGVLIVATRSVAPVARHGGLIERPVPQGVRGRITFNERVRQRDLMDVTDANVRCTLRDGREVTYTGATVLSAEPTSASNGYEIDVQGTLVG